MNISTQKNNILINNEIVFIRKYADMSFFNKEKKEKKKKKKKIKEKIKEIYNPPICWCTNKYNGICCNQQFDDITDYKYHQEECLLCSDNLERLKKEKEEKEEKKRTKQLLDIDDDTLNIIESYERMTGNNLFMAILLGQIDYSLIDKIKKKYYCDLDEEYFMYEENNYGNLDFY